MCDPGAHENNYCSISYRALQKMRILSIEESVKMKERLASSLGFLAFVRNWNLMQLDTIPPAGLFHRFLISSSPVFGVCFFGRALWEVLPEKTEHCCFADTNHVSPEVLLTSFSGYLRDSACEQIVFFPRDDVTSSFPLPLNDGQCVIMEPADLPGLARPSLRYVPDAYFFPDNAKWVLAHVHEGFACLAGDKDFVLGFEQRCPAMVDRFAWEK